MQDDLSIPEKTVVGLINLIFKRKHGWLGFFLGICLLMIPIAPTIYYLREALSPTQGVLPAAISPTQIPTPTVLPPHDSCLDSSFNENDWDLSKSRYRRDQYGYYLPSNSANGLFLYPPLPYKKNIPAIFKNLTVAYEADTFYIALLDVTGRKVFEFNLPEPNRQLVLRNTEIPIETTPTTSPTSLPAISLKKPVSLDGTQEITITSTQDIGNSIIYTLSGHYIDTRGNYQDFTDETDPEKNKIHAKVASADPYTENFTLVIGTKREGKLKVEKFSLCK